MYGGIGTEFGITGSVSLNAIATVRYRRTMQATGSYGEHTAGLTLLHRGFSGFDSTTSRSETRQMRSR